MKKTNIYDNIFMIAKSKKMLTSTKQKKNKLNNRLKSGKAKLSLYFLIYGAFVSIFFVRNATVKTGTWVL